MPNKKFWDLPRASGITGNEVIPLTTEAANTSADLNYIITWFNAKPSAYNFGGLNYEPTVSPFDGGPIPLGAQYYNTVTGFYRVYGNTGWFTPNISSQQLESAIGATLVGTPTGTVQQALDSKVATTALAAASTVAIGGYSVADTQTILDSSYALQDYTALRAYTGRAKVIRITGLYVSAMPQPFVGTFVRDDTDVSSSDDYCTCIVDASSRRWKRQYTDSVSVGWVVGLADGVAVNTAIAVAVTAGIRVVTVPKKAYTFGVGETVGVPAHMTLKGEVPGPFDNFGSAPTATVVGATFCVTNTASVFLTLQGNGSKIEDIIFYYPNQVAPTAPTPTAYPFTIQSVIGTGGTRITRCTFVNAYDAIYIKSGRAKIEDCVIGAYHGDIQIDEAQDWVEIVNVKCQVMWNVFAGLTFPQNIDAWVLSNSCAIRSRRVDSLVVSNFSVYGRFIGHLFEDSANGALSPRCGYGRFSNVDFDYVAYGVYGVSSNITAVGFQYTNVTVGTNSSGVGTVGQWAFGTAVGGTQAPTITVSGGAMRGTWAIGATGVTAPPPAGRIYIDNMRGLNPMGSTKTPTPAVPATTVPVTNNYPSPVRIGIAGGTVSAVLINGVNAGAAQGVHMLYPGETITINYTVAPTWAWHGM